MSGSAKGRNARRREALWVKDPHCADCGVLTIPPHVLVEKYKVLQHEKGWGEAVPREEREKMATLEHCISKLSPYRDKLPQRYLLLCFYCNQARAARQQRMFQKVTPDAQ